MSENIEGFRRSMSEELEEDHLRIATIYNVSKDSSSVESQNISELVMKYARTGEIVAHLLHSLQAAELQLDSTVQELERYHDHYSSTDMIVRIKNNDLLDSYVDVLWMIKRALGSFKHRQQMLRRVFGMLGIVKAS